MPSPSGACTLATAAIKSKIATLARRLVPCQPHTMSSRPVIDVSAHCACGCVQVAIAGKVVSMLLCSCLDCQRATGTGHSTVALVPVDALTVVGTTKSFARPCDSGATFTHYFCPECGTPLHGQSSRAPDIRMIPAGFFAGQNGWFEANQLIFARSRQEWDLIADHLPQHQRYRESQA